MDRMKVSSFSRQLFLLLAATLVYGTHSAPALAQRSQRAGSRQAAANSFKEAIEKVSAENQDGNEHVTSTLNTEIVDPIADDSYAWDDYLSNTDCGAGCDISCGNTVRYRSQCAKPSIYAGFEAVYVKPRFENNVAFSVQESDDNSFSNFTNTEFDYDTEFTPRVFLGWQHQDGVGLRASWWQFDHSAATATASPPANGFGGITHPTFGNVDISTITPTDVFSASSRLNAYAIDLEATKQTSFCSWDLGIGCGVRYAYVEQNYLAQLRNNDNTLLGQIDYQQSIEGIGPTISLDANRPLTTQLSLFGKARGSVLFGDGKSSLNAGEDLDLTTPFTTTQNNNRDDLLSIAEVQLGFRWQLSQRRGRLLRPFLSAAMEGQVWNGAGNATSEDGTLGFFGLNTGLGVDW